MAKSSLSKPAASLSIAALSIAAVLWSCNGTMQEAGPAQTSTVSLDKANVDHANVKLDLKAGELKLSGGTDKLVEGHFQFNVDSYRPKVQSKIDGSHAAITIEQPQSFSGIRNTKNIWDLQLNDEPVMDLTLDCGAGEARMSLGTLNLRSLQVHMGAGEVDLDLSGHPKHDYDVDIAGGVGQATIHLPQGVGIRADVHGGLGNVDVTGLEKKGDHYENDTFDSAKVNVRLKVNGGIGEIRILD